MRRVYVIILLLLNLPNFQLHGQVSSLRTIEISPDSDTLLLDSLSIYPLSFRLYCNNEIVDKSDYYLNGAKSQLIIKNRCGGNLRAEYRVFHTISLIDFKNVILHLFLMKQKEIKSYTFILLKFKFKIFLAVQI